MKNSEMTKFISDHLKTKKKYKHAVKKLPYLLRYVPDPFKTQRICGKSLLENRSLFLTATKVRKCVLKLLIITLMR